MPRLIADLNTIQTALSTAEERAVKLAEGVSEPQATWQPNGGRSWSICQCLDHLARMNLVYGAALREAASNCSPKFRNATTVIVPGPFSRWFIQSMDAPVRRKFKAPAKILAAPSADLQKRLQAFLKSHEVIRTVIASGASVDLNRLRFKNPFVGLLRFTVGSGLMIINAHDRRHLWQAEQVKKAAGYPAS